MNHVDADSQLVGGGNRAYYSWKDSWMLSLARIIVVSDWLADKLVILDELYFALHCNDMRPYPQKLFNLSDPLQLSIARIGGYITVVMSTCMKLTRVGHVCSQSAPLWLWACDITYSPQDHCDTNSDFQLMSKPSLTSSYWASPQSQTCCCQVWDN